MLKIMVSFFEKYHHIEFFFFRFMVSFPESDIIYKILNYITQWSYTKKRVQFYLKNKVRIFMYNKIIYILVISIKVIIENNILIFFV